MERLTVFFLVLAMTGCAWQQQRSQEPRKDIVKLCEEGQSCRNIHQDEWKRSIPQQPRASIPGMR